MDGGGGGEKSRRHRPMVQSSRGWDAAPHSGWGGQTIGTFLGERGRPPCRRPSRRCVPRPPRRRCAPVFPARTSSPRPPMARTLRRPRAPLSPARVGWAGTAVGRPARSWAAVGRARGWLRGVPGDRGRVGGGRAGVAARPGPRGRVGSGPAPWDARLCPRRPRRHLPWMAGPPFLFTSGRPWDPGGPVSWRRAGMDGALGLVSGMSGRGRAGWRPRSTCAACRVQRRAWKAAGEPGDGGCFGLQPILRFPEALVIARGQVLGPPSLLRKGNAALQSLGCVRFRPGPAGLLALRFQPLRTAKHPQGWRGCCHRGRNARCVPPSSARCLRAPVQILPGASHPELL